MHKVLHNITRETLIQRGRAETALVLDIMYSLNCITGKPYTVAQIVEKSSCIGVSERVIRTGLRHFCFYRIAVKTVGRPAMAYILPTPRQVRDFLQLYDASEASDVLPTEALKSVSSYKRHLHAAMIARLTVRNSGRFKMTRAKMAARLAVTIDTIRNYEKTFPIDVQYYIQFVELNDVNVRSIPTTNTHDHSRFLTIEKPNGQTRRYPFIQAIARAAKKAGCRVWRCKQNSNLYMYTGDVSIFGLEPIALPQPPPN